LRGSYPYADALKEKGKIYPVERCQDFEKRKKGKAVEPLNLGLFKGKEEACHPIRESRRAFGQSDLLF